MARERTPFLVRTDPDFHAIIKARAANMNMSVNAYCNAALRWFVLLDEGDALEDSK